MEDQQIETLDQGLQEKPSKPIFLIVISIIGLIEAGWGVIGSLITLITNNFQPADFSSRDEFARLEDTPSLGDMEWVDPDVDFAALAQYEFLSHWISIGGGVLLFIFVFGMLKRKKAAFYPYVVVKLLVAAIPIYLALQIQSDSFVAVTVMWVAIAMALHHLVFIWMFSLNLKHMR